MFEFKAYIGWSDAIYCLVVNIKIYIAASKQAEEIYQNKQMEKPNLVLKSYIINGHTLEPLFGKKCSDRFSANC